MNAACSEFRARLAAVLAARSGPGGEERRKPELAWHAHVLTCGACRDMLEAEQALDELLASLPQPSLPPELARRVLARLSAARNGLSSDSRERALDALIDGALRGEGEASFAPPAALARTMLERLAAARFEARFEARVEAQDGAPAPAERSADSKLDALLELVAAPPAPEGLSARVLAGLASQRASLHALATELEPIRGPQRAISRPTTLHQAPARAAGPVATRPRVLVPVAIAAALAALVGGGLWWWSGARAPQPSIGARGEAVATVPPRESASEPHVASPSVDHAPGAPAVGERAAEIEPLELVEPDEELLAQLDLLESWELITDESLDFELVGIDAEALLGVSAVVDFGSEAESAPTPATEALETRNG